MSTEVMDALASESDFSPIFKYNEPGNTITGPIVEEPRTFPLNEFGTKEPKLDRDGNPVMQVLLVVQTHQYADENHDGRWRTYIDKPLLKAAVLKALKAAGVKTLAVGGIITIEFVGFRETRGGGSAKDFTVTYTPPLGDDADDFGPIGNAELGDTAAEGVPF
jgi:hypothetical protein